MHAILCTQQTPDGGCEVEGGVAVCEQRSMEDEGAAQVCVWWKQRLASNDWLMPPACSIGMSMVEPAMPATIRRSAFLLQGDTSLGPSPSRKSARIAGHAVVSGLRCCIV
jgi:hypothetical protein